MEKENFTKYEVARILGARALQLSMNAPLLIDIEKDELEEINYDTIKIAEIEFSSDVLPITVKRPLPGKRMEKIKQRKIEEPVEEKENVVEIKQREKQAKEEAAAEKRAEEEIAKEGSEIMELSTPEDEVEPVEETKVEE